MERDPFSGAGVVGLLKAEDGVWTMRKTLWHTGHTKHEVTTGHHWRMLELAGLKVTPATRSPTPP